MQATRRRVWHSVANLRMKPYLGLESVGPHLDDGLVLALGEGLELAALLSGHHMETQHLAPALAAGQDHQIQQTTAHLQAENVKSIRSCGMTR